VYKVIFLTNYNPDLPRDEADRRYHDDHAELMRKVPGVERYVQNRWTHSIGEKGVAEGNLAFDVHSECWFTSKQAYEKAMASPEWADVAADSGFFDNTVLAAGVVEERVAITK
jgi:uncharacterized protein (TIGR02118 family)